MFGQKKQSDIGMFCHGVNIFFVLICVSRPHCHLLFIFAPYFPLVVKTLVTCLTSTNIPEKFILSKLFTLRQIYLPQWLLSLNTLQKVVPKFQELQFETRVLIYLLQHAKIVQTKMESCACHGTCSLECHVLAFSVLDVRQYYYTKYVY